MNLHGHYSNFVLGSWKNNGQYDKSGFKQICIYAQLLGAMCRKGQGSLAFYQYHQYCISNLKHGGGRITEGFKIKECTSANL